MWVSEKRSTGGACGEKDMRGSHLTDYPLRIRAVLVK